MQGGKLLTVRDEINTVEKKKIREALKKHFRLLGLEEIKTIIKTHKRCEPEVYCEKWCLTDDSWLVKNCLDRLLSGQ